MSDTEDPSEEWQVRAQDWQTATEWLARRVDALQQQLAQKEHALCTMREVNDYDTKYQLDLEAQLATTTAHLEAQRTATYQAVAREHAAKAQLALAQKGQP